ncbi:hypothetical protein C8J27_110106 [Rhodobacter aestuarii]|uniref:Uncharacterized protein n=1 Tax=Rhodobacter aestuarii TaxID=453582 RepID=A0A1N7Q2L5_9RHOB|nr:hypothetical protein [Rhodobacter aestuarii]PTV94055.1 hypothetical protein C8J27_110106 [Rhodobacter aestuarii]SIT17061.1 hypothetical protein SAMN05421580_112106 [Rhodobacter aestuarii]
MNPISSKDRPLLDGSAEGFRRSAGDLGEVIAILSGGVRPDDWTRSRLAQSLRQLQTFLIAEAHEQEGRKAVSEDAALRAAVATMMARPVSVAMPVSGMGPITEVGHAV